MSRLLLAFLLLPVVALQIAPPQLPGNTTPGQPVAPPDPAAATFTTEGGFLFVTVKADKVDDYEDAIRALQEAFSKATDEKHRKLAEGWRVYKGTDANPKAIADPKTATVIYIHVIHPIVPEADYRPSLLLDELLEGAPPELLAKYRDAIAAPANKLGMSEFAHMSEPPKPKPTNASPDAPGSPKPPGNASPKQPGNTSPKGPAH